MGQLLVRNLSETTVSGLKRMAADHGRSLEAEHRAILDEAVASSGSGQAKTAWIERARQLREETRDRSFTPSEVLIAELRDEP